jgi:hypothetical protein
VDESTGEVVSRLTNADDGWYIIDAAATSRAEPSQNSPADTSESVDSNVDRHGLEVRCC